MQKNWIFLKNGKNRMKAMGVELEAFKTRVCKLTTTPRTHFYEADKFDLLYGSISKTLERATFCIGKFFVINFYQFFSLIRKKWSKKKLLHKANSTTFFWQLFFYSTENSIKILEKNLVNSTNFFQRIFGFLAFFMVYSEVRTSSYEVSKSNTSNGSLVSVMSKCQNFLMGWIVYLLPTPPPPYLPPLHLTPCMIKINKF